MSLITLLRVVSILKTHMFYRSVICLSILSETFNKDYIIIRLCINELTSSIVISSGSISYEQHSKKFQSYLSACPIGCVGGGGGGTSYGWRLQPKD